MIQTTWYTEKAGLPRLFAEVVVRLDKYDGSTVERMNLTSQIPFLRSCAGSYDRVTMAWRRWTTSEPLYRTRSVIVVVC